MKTFLSAQRVRFYGLVAVAGLVVLISAVDSPASGPPLSEGFETGATGWTTNALGATGATQLGATGPTGATTGPTGPSMWHIQANPQTISVANPSINPTLVTLPDSGQLPPAFTGTHVAWFGDPANGTFCGHDWNTSGLNKGASKNGCMSSQIEGGDLTSPPFSLVGAASAQLDFDAWWEVEGVDSNQFDLMSVQYSTDGGTTWHPACTTQGSSVSDPNETCLLNPANRVSGTPDQSSAADGLEAVPQWHHYFVDLTPAIGSRTVKVRFEFNTVDVNFNGFRGWLIDNVLANVPYAEPAPSITSLAPACADSSTPFVSVLGANFPLGSQISVDGSTSGIASNTPSDQRMEFAPGSLSPGQHAIRVISPHAGATSNAAMLTVASSCTSPPPTPSTTNTTTSSPNLQPTPQLGVAGTSTTSNNTPPPPVVLGCAPSKGKSKSPCNPVELRKHGKFQVFVIAQEAGDQFSLTATIDNAKAAKSNAASAAAAATPAVYGTASATATAPGPVALTVNPTKAARKALKRHHHLNVTVHLSFRSSAHLGSATSTKDFRIAVKSKGKKKH